ncbi:MAG: hypothetical protein WDN31_15960 [Hyphomicrobium sp.]
MTSWPSQCSAGTIEASPTEPKVTYEETARMRAMVRDCAQCAGERQADRADKLCGEALSISRDARYCALHKGSEG